MNLFYKIEVLVQTVPAEMTLPKCAMHFVISKQSLFQQYYIKDFAET